MSKLLSQSVGLVFGTDTGMTEEVGNKIATQLANYGVDVSVINVVDTTSTEIESFDFILFGIPTWDFGGIQEDWENFEEDILATNLSGKVVALYGLGDQLGYGDYFVDAMGWLQEKVIKAGAHVIGEWSTEGYDFAESRAANEDKSMFCGLAIDEDQQFELTDERIEKWVEQLIKQYESTEAA